MDSLVFDRSSHLIGYAVDAGERLHFIGLTLRRSAILAAVPDLSCVAAVEANDLSKVSKCVGSDPADHDGQTGIELIGGRWLPPSRTARSSIPRTMFSRAQLPS